MGGPGSGESFHHWWRAPKKAGGEDCRDLDANRWTREGLLKAGVWHYGRWCWFRDAARTEETASIGYEVNTSGDPAYVRLTYTLTRTQEQIDYRIGLTTTRPRFGGLRWWFVCPLVVNGRP